MTKWNPEWRRVLQLRSHEDTMAIAIDCDLLPVGDLNIVTELVREGIIRYVQRTTLWQLGVIDTKNDRIRLGINVDVYMLTLRGIRLCNEYGIEQQ